MPLQERDWVEADCKPEDFRISILPAQRIGGCLITEGRLNAFLIAVNPPADSMSLSLDGGLNWIEIWDYNLPDLGPTTYKDALMMQNTCPFGAVFTQ